MSLRFGVRNILDSETRYTYGSSFADGNIFQAYKRGPTYGFSLTAEF